MPFGQLPIEALSEADLQALVDNRVTEGKDVDYKEALHSNNDGDKKEYFADVSSFVNASGGWLIWGIRDKKGMPVEVCGVELENPDRTVVSLENSILDGIEPRMVVQTRGILLASGRYGIVMHIPHSWNAPHRIKFQRWGKFWSRTSNGKYEMDVNEIRAAFLRSENVVERVRTFRSTRIARVQKDETPIALNNGAKIVLHLVPMQAFDPAAFYDVAGLQSNTSIYSSLYPINSGTSSSRHNFDGFLTYSKRRDEDAEGYVQVFRNSIIEAVDGSMLSTDRSSSKMIPSILFEQELIQSLRRYLAVEQLLGVELPVAILLTLVGVRGYGMAVDPSHWFRNHEAIDRDLLEIPETLVDRYDADAAQVLRPLFDTVWNAAGWPRSMNYDQHGSWVRERR